MKYGYVLKHYSEDLSLNPELIENRTRNMEDIGFDSIWITDHILLPKGSRLPKYEKITEIITTLAYLGGKTNNIKLGLSTLVLPARNAILAAKQLSTLHYFLGDRLIPSFGAGWAESEFQLLDQEFHNRGERFNEQLEVIRTLFNGDHSFEGKYHKFQNAELKPRRPGLNKMPLYVAGNSKYAVERSLKYGDGWHPVNLSPHKVGEMLDNYDELKPENIIVRLGLDDQSVADITQQYADLGIEYVIYDDRSDLDKFERIIQYVRSFQEFQP